MIDVSTLTALPLFRNLPPASLNALLTQARILHFDAGETLFSIGDRAETALLLLSGDVAVRLPEGDGHRVVGEVRPGEVTGETALLNQDGQRGATVIAQSAVECLELSPALMVQAANNPAIVAIERHLLLTLAARIRRTNQNIQHALSDTTDPRPLRARLRAILETP